MKRKDFYATLGVEKNATQDQIKTAFRQKAKKYHPDVNKSPEATELFKEYTKAYQVLSNPDARKKYDTLGQQNNFNFSSQKDFSDFFGSVFKDSNFQGFSFSNFSNNGKSTFSSTGRRNRGRSKGPFDRSFFGNSDFPGFDFSYGNDIKEKVSPKVVDIYCDLKELFFGNVRKFLISHNRINPSGQNYTEKVELGITIKPGYKEGTKITFSGMGDQFKGMQAGDIIFIIKEKSHPIFKRDKDDLHMVKTVSLKEALTGVCFFVKSIDEKNFKVDLTKGIVMPGKVFYISDAGMVNSKNWPARGRLVIKFDVKFPSYLNDDQRNALKNIL